MSGKFIVFEGLDGSSKSTQVEKLTEYLMNKNISVFKTQEPSTGLIGKTIREYLKEDSVDNETLQYLFMADRNEHIKTIKKVLDSGAIVLCDRYWYSAFAYQQGAVEEINIIDKYIDTLVPDLVIYIDTPVDTCMKRISTRGDQKESFEKKEYLERTQERYNYLWKNEIVNPSNLAIINGNQSKEKVFEDIKQYLQKLEKLA